MGHSPYGLMTAFPPFQGFWGKHHKRCKSYSLGANLLRFLDRSSYDNRLKYYVLYPFKRNECLDRFAYASEFVCPLCLSFLSLKFGIGVYFLSSLNWEGGELREYWCIGFYGFNCVCRFFAIEPFNHFLRRAWLYSVVQPQPHIHLLFWSAALEVSPQLLSFFRSLLLLSLTLPPPYLSLLSFPHGTSLLLHLPQENKQSPNASLLRFDLVLLKTILWETGPLASLFPPPRDPPFHEKWKSWLLSGTESFQSCMGKEKSIEAEAGQTKRSKDSSNLKSLWRYLLYSSKGASNHMTG